MLSRVLTSLLLIFSSTAAVAGLRCEVSASEGAIVDFRTVLVDPQSATVRAESPILSSDYLSATAVLVPGGWGYSFSRDTECNRVFTVSNESITHAFACNSETSFNGNKPDLFAELFFDFVHQAGEFRGVMNYNSGKTFSIRFRACTEVPPAGSSPPVP